jgi:ArsR family transcriptional regulator
MLPGEIGERTEAAVLAALVQAGKQVVLPFGEQRRYDLAYEEDGRLIKVQCKSGSVRKGAVCFRTHSVGRSSIRDYRGEVDYFGIYCHDRREVYLVPVDELPVRRGSLRVDPPKNGQACGVRHASRYVLAGGEDPIPSVRYIDTYQSFREDAEMASIALEVPVLCCAPLGGTEMGDEQATATADLFKALSDPHRVKIVNLLANAGEAVCVCDITDAIDLSQPTVSFHLKKLVSSGLLDREKRSTWAYYSLNRKALNQLADIVKVKGKRS